MVITITIFAIIIILINMLKFFYQKNSLLE